MKLLKAIAALSALVSLGTADIDTWKPEYTLEVDSVPLYPAHPSDAPWTFSVPQGKSCTLAPASICCDSGCHALNVTRPSHEEETVQLGSVTVAFKKRSLVPTSFGELPDLLDTYNNETGLINDADSAAGKMFEFAVRVAEQVQLGKRLPQDVIDAAAAAVGAIGKVTDAEGKSIAGWLYLVDKAKLSGESDNPRIAGNPSGLIRAAVNRMQWFKVMGENLSDPAKATELAAAVLHDLGANWGIFEQHKKLGVEGSIPQGLDAFVGQTQMPQDPDFKGIETRKCSIVFSDDVPNTAASVFCDALDGVAGSKDLDKTNTYFTTLTERQHNLALNTSFVTDVVVEGSAIDFTDRTPVPKNDTSRLGRRQDNPNRSQRNAPDYLKRVSQRRHFPIDAADDYTFRNPPGAGVTIFVVGSGLAYTPEVIEELSLVDLEEEEFFYAVQPENALPPYVSTEDLVGEHGEDSVTGSGTAMAVLAAGNEYGVAKEANIRVVQAHWRYKRREDGQEIESTGPLAMNEAFNHIISTVIQEGMQGKAVVVISRAQRYSTAYGGITAYRSHWTDFLMSARELDVTVVLGSGQRHRTLNSDIPNCLWMLDDGDEDRGYDFTQWIDYNRFPEVIHARSAEADGSYSWFNGPLPHGGGPDYIYAQGGDVECLRGDGEVWATSEMNNAAAIIAGVAATYLADPDYAEYFMDNDDIPLAVKRLLEITAYPRTRMARSREERLSGFVRKASEMCDDEAVAELVRTYPFELPRTVPMVYNSAWGEQNACNTRRGWRALHARQEDSANNSTESSEGDSSSEGSSDAGSSSGDPSDPLSDEMDMSCQDMPAITGTYEEPPEENPEDETTGQSWLHQFCIPLPADEDELGGVGFFDDEMTPDVCSGYCCGAMYMALRGGNECICIAGPTHIAALVLSNECNVSCPGSGGSGCGGEESADVYLVDQIASVGYCRAQRGEEEEDREEGEGQD